MLNNIRFVYMYICSLRNICHLLIKKVYHDFGSKHNIYCIAVTFLYIIDVYYVVILGCYEQARKQKSPVTCRFNGLWSLARKGEIFYRIC